MPPFKIDEVILLVDAHYLKLRDDEKMAQMTKSVSIPNPALVRQRKTATMNQLHDIAGNNAKDSALLRTSRPQYVV